MAADIKSLARDELEARLAAWQQPSYRVTQLLEWLYSRRVTNWDDMTNLPAGLRDKLAADVSRSTLWNSSASKAPTMPPANFSGGCAIIP